MFAQIEFYFPCQDAAEDGTVIVLLGNKVDLVADSTAKRVVSVEAGEKLAAVSNPHT